MKKLNIQLLTLNLILGVFVLPARAARPTAPPKIEFVPGELIVRYKTEPATLTQTSSNINTRFSSVNERHSRHKVRQQERLFKQEGSRDERISRIYRLKLDDTQDIRTIANDYKNDPNVEFAEPNYIFKTSMTPNDPSLASQWSLVKIQAQLGWDMTTGSSKVIVADVDTGVDLNHPDLKANIWHNTGEIAGNGRDDDGNGYVDDVDGYNAVNPAKSPMDDFGHGTHVAGIIGAVGNNGVGISGVSWTCQIMAVKGLDEKGSGTAQALADGIMYAASNGAKIINCSWGSYGYSDTIKAAVDYAINVKGCLVVAAAGNDGQDLYPMYPAAFPNVFAVASTDKADYPSYFSNYGTWVSISAPGEDIYSTMPTYPVTLNGPSYGIPQNYANLSGTSMATPHVSGLAALLLAAHPSFASADIKKYLLNGVDPVSLNYGTMGAGRINVNKSLQNAAVKYPLTVVNGLGSGSYLNGVAVTITANAPTTGMVFNNWSGATVVDASASQTRIVMPSVPTTVTANYKGNKDLVLAPKPNEYVSPVSAYTYSGTCVGNPLQISFSVFGYSRGSQDVSCGSNNTWSISIAPPGPRGPGQVTLTDKVTQETYSVSMFFDVAGVHTYNLAVQSGSGSGPHLPNEVVNISAAAAPAGQTFDKWTGYPVANANLANTSLTMPSADISVSASYRSATAGSLEFSADTYVRNEDKGAATITVNRVGGTDGMVSVAYQTSHGTAKDGDDYLDTSGVLTWANGDSSPKTFQVSIIDDLKPEPDETVNLTLLNPTGLATLAVTSGAILKIHDDDLVLLTVANGTGGGLHNVGDVVSIAASPAPAGMTFHQWTGAAFADATSPNTTMVMPAMNTTVTATYTDSTPPTVTNLAASKISGRYASVVWITDEPADSHVEFGLTASYGDVVDDATLSTNHGLVLTNLTPNTQYHYRIRTVDASGNATISGDQTFNTASFGSFQFSAANYSEVENKLSALITVQRVNGSYGAASVIYTTKDGTAKAGTDYVATPQPEASPSASPVASPSPLPNTLYFGDGETKKTFVVTLYDDSIFKGDRSLSLLLIAPTGGATLGSPATATLTITDNDSPRLTVVNGTGSGLYAVGAQVSVTANAAPTGQVFDKWTGAAVADPKSPSTTLVMPYANVTLTATFVSATPVPTPTPLPTPPPQPTPLPPVQPQTEFLPFNTTFNPTVEFLVIRYTIGNEGTPRLTIENNSHQTIVTLPVNTSQSTWDGRDANGMLVGNGTYFARLQAGTVDQSVEITVAGIAGAGGNPSGSTGSFGIFINKTKGPMDVKFNSSKVQNAKLTLYDMHGKKITTLFDGPCTVGSNPAPWNGKDEHGDDVGSDVYVLYLDLDGKTTRQKVVVSR